MRDQDAISAEKSPLSGPLTRPSSSPLSSTASSPASNEHSSSPVEVESSVILGRPVDHKALASMSIEDEEQEQMFRSLAAICQNAQQQEGSLDLSQVHPGELWSSLQRADASSHRGIQDVAALQTIKSVLDQMNWKQSQFLVAATKVLADASRELAWRSPLGESGVFDFYLGIVAADNILDDLRHHALRLVGNSCVDTDENRQRVIAQNQLQAIIQQLDNPTLASIVIPVLYNICYDYEPTQQLASSSGLNPALIKVLEGGSLAANPLLSYLCRLLDFLTERLNAEQSPENSVEVLLRTASSPDLDVDDRVSLVDSAIAHLKLERFQRHMIVQGVIEVPLLLLLRSYSPQSIASDILRPENGNGPSPIRNVADEEAVSTMRRNVIQALSDVSALPEFSAHHSSMNTTLTTLLLKWFTAPHASLQLCSCIMLGNLARTDLTCQIMTTRFRVHEDLLAMLKESSDTQVLHSALSFLRNLGLPLENKQILGEADVFENISRFWVAEVLPQLSYAAVSLARQLVNGSIPNIWKLLNSLSADEESPAHSKTYLSILLSLFEKSDDITIKIEIARIVAAILRCIHSQDTRTDSGLGKILPRLYALHPDVGRPLAMMVSQSRWPIIRSEGWFAMALMARSMDGSAAIDGVLQEVEVFGALGATIRGEATISSERSSPTSQNSGRSRRDGPDPSEMKSRLEREVDMKAKDRENAMVLVNEMLRNRGDEMADIRRNVLEDLLIGQGMRTEES